MTNNVNVSDLAKLAQDLLNEKEHGQEFMLSDVHNITRQAYENYPEDTVIRQFAYVIEQMADKQPHGTTISQKEMTKIYNDLVRLSGDSKFRKVLGMFVMDTQTAKTASEEYIAMNRVDADNTQLSLNEYVDKDLVDALDGLFGGSIKQEKAYSDEVAEKGAEYVKVELEALGFKPKVDILGGDKSTLVYVAHFDTQKGLVAVAVPINISSNKLLLPSTFVADDHLEELTADKLSYFIDKKAYTNNFSVPNVNAILKAVGMMTGQVKTASNDEFEVNLERFNDRGEVVHLSTPELISDKELAEPQPYIDTTPDVEMPKELAHLAQDFEDDVLEAVSSFGKDAVKAGKHLVLAELAEAGFKNAQVRFGAESGDSICYMAAIATPKGPVEIEIPVEMQETANSGYRPLAPSYFACDGLIEDFTSSKLQRFALSRPAPSSGQVVYSTEHSYMTLPELRDEIIKAASDSDYVACEMILGTIQERFAEEDYKNAVADYHYLLMLKNNREENAPKCSKEIPAGKGSIEARCGHFGVPMSKVVVGEDGHCKLRSSVEREKLNPVEESGAAISTSKLFWS
jgi:hypothetical protein